MKGDGFFKIIAIQLLVNWWILGIPLSNNPFHKGIPAIISSVEVHRTSGRQTSAGCEVVGLFVGGSYHIKASYVTCQWYGPCTAAVYHRERWSL